MWQKYRALETEGFIESLIDVFQKYAGKDGNKCNLSKTESLTFMSTELASLMKNQRTWVSLLHDEDIGRQQQRAARFTRMS